MNRCRCVAIGHSAAESQPKGRAVTQALPGSDTNAPVVRRKTKSRALVSGNHATVEQLVRDRRGHLVDERLPHCRIVAHRLNRLSPLLGLLVGGRRRFLHQQICSRSVLILLDHLLRDSVHHRVLLRRLQSGGAGCNEQESGNNDDCDRSSHVVLLSGNGGEPPHAIGNGLVVRVSDVRISNAPKQSARRPPVA
jgi:hypothetical protein